MARPKCILCKRRVQAGPDSAWCARCRRDTLALSRMRLHCHGMITDAENERIKRRMAKEMGGDG